MGSTYEFFMAIGRIIMEHIRDNLTNKDSFIYTSKYVDNCDFCKRPLKQDFTVNSNKDLVQKVLIHSKRNKC